MSKLLAMAVCFLSLSLSLLPCETLAHRYFPPPPPPRRSPPPPPLQHAAPASASASASAPAPPPPPSPPAETPVSPSPLPSPSHGRHFHIAIFVVVALAGGGAGSMLGYLAIRSTCPGAVSAHVFEVTACASIRKHASLYSDGTRTLTDTITALTRPATHTYQKILVPGVLFDLVKKGYNGVMMADILSGLARTSLSFVEELPDQLLLLDFSILQGEAAAIDQGAFFGTLYERGVLPLSSLRHIRLSAHAVEKNAFLMAFLKAFFQHVTGFRDPPISILEAMGGFFDGDTEKDFIVWKNLIDVCGDTLLGYRLLLLAMKAEGSISREFFLCDPMAQEES